MSALLRRDPRSERIARNRLHPEHEAVLRLVQGGAPAQWLGPNGVIRKNPHAVGFVGPNGLRRIDRSGAQSGATVARRAAERATENAAPARRLVRIAEPAFLVAVVADLPGGRLSAHDRDLLGLARTLADADAGRPGAVLLITFGATREDGYAEAGVDRLLHFDAAEYHGYAPQARAQALMAVEAALRPGRWIFADSPLGGADLGRRFAALCGERPAHQVWQASHDRCTGRGAAGTVDITRALPRVVLALSECAEPVSETVHEALPLALPPAVSMLADGIEDCGAVAVDPGSVALDEAEFILSAGNGVTDWDGFHEAARVLGATEGASRVAVDNGHMARSRQVGATGTWVTARVYVAVGISGAVQHLQGIQTCEKVVAINSDPGCDMIRRANLAIIGDSAAVLSALVERVRVWKESGDASNQEEEHAG